jgi:hypothetical protein
MKKIILFSLILVTVFFSCKKKDTNSGAKLFTFNGITADHDTILKGNVTNIKANVSGPVTYSWAASAGDIFGSGATITFGASTCCTGKHTITCTAIDANNNKDSKAITIQVNQ